MARRCLGLLRFVGAMFVLALPAALPNAATLRVSVVASVGPRCGASVLAPALRRMAAERLSGAGITVSSIHNSQLEVGVDCIARTPSRRSQAISVSECVTFSEPLATLSSNGKTIVGSAWQGCQSFACTRAKCDAALTREDVLLNALLDDFQERDAAGRIPEPAPHQPTSVFAAPPLPLATPPAGRAYSYSPPPDHALGRLIFYSTYIMTCLSLFVYWQFRSKHQHY
jgi:hypothetical protein